MDQDLKDAIKKLEEAKNRQERIERIIILLSGLLIVIIFAIIGINLYSGKEETVSEPEINIIAKKENESAKKQQVSHEESKNENISTKKTSKKSAEREEGEKNLTVSKEKTYISEEKQPQPQKKNTTIKEKPKKEKKHTKETSKENKEIKTEIPKIKENKSAINIKETIQPGYYIQAGAFSRKKKAEILLKKLNLPNAFIRKEGELYKVLVGKFKNRKEAYNFMKKHNINGFVRKI